LEGWQTIDLGCDGREAASYMDATARSAGAVTELTALRKFAITINLEQSYIVQPLDSKMWVP